MSPWVFRWSISCPHVGIGHGEPEPELRTGLSSVESCIPQELPMALFRGYICVALGREKASVGSPILKDMGLVGCLMYG